MNLIDRFKSAEGKRLLIDAFAKQTIINGDRKIAERLSDVCVLEEFARGAKIIEQGGSDNDIFFLIGGAVSIVINGREINARRPGQHVGEMAMIDASARRSATVIAQENTVIARVSEAQFSKIANDFPSLWRIIAIELGDRLRQRSKFIREPNPQPHLFIGSSKESLAIAKCIHSGLVSDPVSVYVWTDDIFTASKTAIEALETELLRADFAILVLGPDDHVFSRGRDDDAPRDNVIFELGLFMGALTRGRTFFVKPSDKTIKIPSDLVGVIPITYESAKGDLGEACEAIRKLVKSSGPR